MIVALCTILTLRKFDTGPLSWVRREHAAVRKSVLENLFLRSTFGKGETMTNVSASLNLSVFRIRPLRPLKDRKLQSTASSPTLKNAGTVNLIPTGRNVQ